MNATTVFERVKSLFERDEWHNSNWEVESREIREMIDALDLKETGKLVDSLFEFATPIHDKLPVVNPINGSIGKAISEFQEKFWKWVREVEDSQKGKNLDELMSYIKDLTEFRLLILTHPEPKAETAIESLVAGTLFIELAGRD